MSVVRELPSLYLSCVYIRLLVSDPTISLGRRYIITCCVSFRLASHRLFHWFRMKLLFLIVLAWMVSDGASTVAENMDHEEFTSAMEDQESESYLIKSAENMDHEELTSAMEDQESEPCPTKYRNLALHGRATQSSILSILEYGYLSMAINAIDGNQDSDFSHGSCSHTNNDFSPWWRVDLLTSYKINHITITNRGGCCEERLNGAEILVGDSLANNGNNNQRCAVVTAIPRGATQTFQCHNMVGRYVNVIVRGRKEYLHMCEVQVFGSLH
ncbi:fucolectin-like [Phyllobates terribilis]|uniref:fucolectin-like n=1 Tax=Phyllobates terribilis TaxID=111132 RepID=UPI003CCA8C52